MPTTSTHPLGTWLELLACPGCAGAIVLSDDNVHLQCSQCVRSYPVADGIVRCLDLQSDQAEDRIKQQELEARDQGADGYDRDDWAAHARLEIPACLAAMRPGADDVVAELGCGTGRITLRYLADVRRVVAVDFSLRSLQLLQERIPEHLRERILLVQADVTAVPLAARAYSQVTSFQVLEHLPTPEARQLALERAARLLRPGGAFTFSVYNWSREKQALAARGEGDYTQKEGYHDSGIYYYNYEDHEVRRGLEQAGLTTELLHGLIIPVRGGSLLGPFTVLLNRWLASTRYGRERGHLLLGRGRAPSTHSS